MNRLQYLFQFLSRLWRRLLSLLRRGRYEREMEEEMLFHIEMQIEQNLAAGIPAEEAHYAARRQFGNQTWLKEASRDMWGFRSLETLAQDIRYSLRIMVRNPGFTAVVVLTLMLGIGVCTAVFSMVHAVMLKPLPYRDSDRLCVLWKSVPKKGLEGIGLLIRHSRIGRSRITPLRTWRCSYDRKVRR